MITIAIAASLGILIVQALGAIPQSSVGGPLTIGLFFVAVALVVGLYEAWTQRRNFGGWIVNLVVVFIGAFIGAQLAGDMIATLIGAVLDVQGSIAKTEGMPLSIALVLAMLANVFSAWAALWVVNRWRGRTSRAA